MLYDADNPTDYIESLDVDWRKEKLLELRAIILEQAPEVTETINYKMLCFKLDGSVLFHLNAQKGYVSLYCGDTKKIDSEGVLLDGLNHGKGCIRFTKTKDISKTGIKDFIKLAVSLSQEGNIIDC